MKQIEWKTIKEYEDILFDFCDGIAKITINRPQVYNAFRPQTNSEMLDAMSICRERPDIGVVILTVRFTPPRVSPLWLIRLVGAQIVTASSSIFTKYACTGAKHSVPSF